MRKRIIQNIILILFLCTQVFSQNNYKTEVSVEGNYGEQRILNSSLLNGNNKLFTIQKIIKPHYSIPKAIALQNGNLALLHSLEGVFEIYDNTSQLIFEKGFYSLPPYKEQNIKYFTNNMSIILLVSEQQKNIIYIVGNSGNPIGEFNIESGLISGIAASKDNKVIAYSVLNWNRNELLSKTTFFNIGKNYSSEIPIKFENGSFNKTNDLFLGTSNKNSFCLDINKEEILWQNELTNDQIYLDAMFENNNVILVKAKNPKLIKNKWTYDNTRVVRKELSGVEILVREISKPVFNVGLIMNKDKLFINVDDNISLLTED